MTMKTTITTPSLSLPVPVAVALFPPTESASPSPPRTTHYDDDNNNDVRSRSRKSYPRNPSSRSQRSLKVGRATTSSTTPLLLFGYQLPQVLPAVLLLLLLMRGPSPASGQDACFTSLNSLVLREANVQDTTVARTYTLCAGTEFQIGKLNFDNELQDGQEMIPLRPNLRIKCGDTGQKENNCFVKGGDVQVDGTHYFGVSASETLENVVLEGITFFSSERHSVWLTKPGDVVFRNCEFRVRNNTAQVESNPN